MRNWRKILIRSAMALGFMGALGIVAMRLFVSPLDRPIYYSIIIATVIIAPIGALFAATSYCAGCGGRMGKKYGRPACYRYCPANHDDFSMLCMDCCPFQNDGANQAS